VTQGNAVAYYRVSSDPQAQFGCSLERQRQVVRQYARDHSLELIAEHTEVESAYRRGSINIRKRPGLQEALKTCKSEKATLLIATLDRLARNVVLIATLIETRVDFVALDVPDATPFMLHIFAAVAEEESRQRGRLISAAKALSKARGKVFVPNVRARVEASKARAETYRPVLEEIRATGLRGSYRITKELERRGVTPPTAKPWYCDAVVHILRRLGLYEKPTKSGIQLWVGERKAIREPLRATILELRTSGMRGRKVADALNARGLRTGQGQLWTRERVVSFLRYRPRP
jgi:DNA invertase Pin-like site-specific DNA recombinase